MAPPEEDGQSGSTGGEGAEDEGPPLSQPPHSAASSAVKDPSVSDAEVAPSPGAPTADANNVLTLSVPKENTVLQMGAASAGPSPNVPPQPGFRMSTLTHAHLTAQTPLTTVSLGAPGGEGMGGVPGLSIYSAAQKDERITQKVNAHYGADYVLKVDGQKQEEIQGDKWFKNWGTEHKETGGLTSETFIGGKNEIHVGAKTEFALAGSLGVFVGLKKEIMKGPVWEARYGSKTELVKGSTKAATYGNTDEFQEGNKHEVHNGSSTEVQHGAKDEKLFGNSKGFQRGDKTEALQGNSTEVQQGNKEETHRGNVTASHYGNSSETRVGQVESKVRGVVKKEVEMEMEEVKSVVSKIKSTILDAGIMVTIK